MLLELRALAESLRQAGITATHWDDCLVPYPARPTFEIRLTHEGQIVGVKALAPERVATLRKYECSTGGMRESSPGFNVDPLFVLRDGEDSKEFTRELKKFQTGVKRGGFPTETARQTELTKLMARCEPGWSESRVNAVNLSLKRAAEVFRARLGEGFSAEIEPLCELLRRSRLQDAIKLREKLAELAVQRVVQGESGSFPEAFVQLLFAKAAAVVLELANGEEYTHPANHQTVLEAVNRRLLAPAAGSAPPQEGGVGVRLGIFGEPAEESESKMPERTVPRLGKVKLRSLAKSIPCQFRYRLIEAGACPVGAEIQADLAAALEWITHEDRQFDTWADVSDACGFDLRAILIAYPSRMPREPGWFSGLFASGADAGPQAEKLFESYAQTVTERLQGVMKEDPRTSIAVFVLAKADAARTKLLYTRQFSAERILTAGREWQEAAANVPPLRVRRFGGEGRPQWVAPQTPFPGRLVRCLNTVWRRAGAEAERVSGLDIGTGLSLFLEEGPSLSDPLAVALRQALTNSTPLLLALGHAHNRGQVHRVPARFEDQPLVLPSCLGLLLAKSRSMKETYMNSNPYLIGRLLSLADKLHWNYCRLERKGEQPPQLLGNSLMPTALENPVAGLARLSERLMLYLRCASGRMHQEVAAIEQEIDKTRLPTRCGDIEKAQMLLGYLARGAADQGEEQTPQTGEQA